MPRRAKNAEERKSRGVEAVDRAVSILLSFSDGRPSLTLTELAERTGYYKSTILRVIASLEDAGFILRGTDKIYRLGPRVMQMSAVYQKSLRLDTTIRPVLRELLAATGESASFFRRNGDQRICLLREESEHPVREHIYEGDVLPIDRGAAGSVLMEFAEVAPNTDEFISLLSSLPLISFGERDAALCGVAVPVFSATDHLAGALSLSGPISRFTEERLDLMTRVLLGAGNGLSEAFGGATY